jgi:ribonuclease T2
MTNDVTVCTMYIPHKNRIIRHSLIPFSFQKTNNCIHHYQASNHKLEMASLHFCWSSIFLLVTFLSSATKYTFAANLRNGKNQNQDFDFYVLSMSFQPEFCHQHRTEHFPGCERPLDFWRGSLTLHGLWPEDYDGSWPSSCTKEKFDPKTVDDLGPDRFDRLWPNVKATENDGYLRYSFWEHEWTKHGTCTGLTQDEYFDTALKHFLPTPQLVRDNYGMSTAVKREELLEAYRNSTEYYNNNMYGDVVLVCSGGKYLSEVRTCVAKSKDGSGSRRIKCIPQVQQESNCGNEVFFAKFYVDQDDGPVMLE